MLCDAFRVLCLTHCVLLLALTTGLAEPQQRRSSAPEFKRYTIVQPVVQHGRTKRDITSTRDTTGEHHAEVTLKVPIDGEELILDLRLNQDLIPDNHVLTYQKDENTVVHKPKAEEIDLCHYGGVVRGRPDSWAAVSTCHGVQGVVFDGQTMRYIEPAQGGNITSEHLVYDHSDLTVSNKCGNDDAMSHPPYYHSQEELKKSNKAKLSRRKRRASEASLHAPYNANERSRYVEMVMVADRSLFEVHKGNMNSVYRQMKTLANMLNSVYSPLNIYIALIGVQVWNQHDMIVFRPNSSAILKEFTMYRRQVLLKTIPNDNAHLITNHKFDGNIVGKAYTGAICSWGESSSVSSYHTNVLGLQAMTIAHELGHNLGMPHDEDVLDEYCECPDRKCIMSSSSTSVVPIHWSSCSLAALARSFSKGVDTCLRNKPKSLFDSRSPTCGNGFVEPGEDCDCGSTLVRIKSGEDVLLKAGPSNPCHACCNPDTCRLRANATCGTGMCCDLQTCRPKSAGTVCRSAARECDLPEYCTGRSEFCPDDVHKMDTTPCGEGEMKAYCVRGECHSHASQCRLLWGSTGRNSEDGCYHNNNAGSLYGNCGYDRLTDQYWMCEDHNVMCGRLHCTRLGNKLQLTATHVTGHRTFTRPGTIVNCHTATIDTGMSELDPGMVPDGARCGHEMMCLEQKCVSVAAVRQTIANGASSVCPSNCSGHGVCNSAGQCHCEAGFSPPLCAEPGSGGSVSSGPATNPAIQRRLMIALYVIFLGILPLVLLILFLIYYFRPGVFKRCTECLQQKLKYHDYLGVRATAAKSSKSRDSLIKSQQPPDIIHHLLDSDPCKESNTTADLPKPHSKSNSTIYTNITSLTGQKTVVISSNEKIHVSSEVIYANCEISNIDKSTDKRNLHHFGINFIKAPHQNLKKVGNIASDNKRNPLDIKVVNLPSVRKTPGNVISSPGVHLRDAPENCVTPQNNLRKTLTNTNMPSDSIQKPTNKSSNTTFQNTARGNVVRPSAKDLPKKPENVVNFTDVKLRKGQANKVKPAGQNVQNSTDDTVEFTNIKLRKTPGNIVKSNVENTGNIPSDNKNKILPNKPNITLNKPHIVNTKNIKRKPDNV